jgi:hypothetical protein
VAATEFALSLPFLLLAGLYGLETGNLALTQMKVNQVAMHLADNASRIGDTDTISNREIFESDINDLLYGSNIQGGNSLDFYNRGRAVISFLEVFQTGVSCSGGSCPTGPHKDGDQYIQWQRCKGTKHYSSSYGTERQVVNPGMGPSGQQVSAEPGSAVIFVEVAYDYKPLFSSWFIRGTTITAVSSYVMRDSVDLSGLKQRNPNLPDPPSYCNVYNGYPANTIS